MIIKEKRLCRALTLVIAGADAYGVYISPILLGLRMNRGISIDLAGGSLQDTGAHTLSGAEHIYRPHDGGLYRLYGIVLIVRRRCRTGEVVYLIDLGVIFPYHIMPHKFKIFIIEQLVYIFLGAGEKIVKTDNLIARLHKTPAKMRADKSRSSGNKYPQSPMPPCRERAVHLSGNNQSRIS